MIITGSLDITPIVDGVNGKNAVAYQMNATPATVEFNGSAETIVTSICKEKRMEELFKRFRPDYVLV